MAIFTGIAPDEQANFEKVVDQRIQRNLNFWKYLCSREANIYRLT